MAPLDTATTAELDATASASEPMKSLRTGLRVLLEFEHDQRDFSVTELAVRCGLSKSQVSKILSALVDSGLLVQDPVTRTYSVGQRCYVLGSRFTTYDSLCQATTPVMRELLNRTGHSVRLSVPDGDQTLYLIGLEGPMFMDTGWRSGSSVPFGASSAGRVLMAYLDARTVDRLLSLPVPPSPPTPCATARRWSAWWRPPGSTATACSATRHRWVWAWCLCPCSRRASRSWGRWGWHSRRTMWAPRKNSS